MEKKQRRKKNGMYYTVLAGVFGGIVLLFFILHIVIPDAQSSAAEKRMLARFPEVSVGSVLDGEFSSSFEEYASDQMPLRTQFIALKSAADTVLGKNESQDVYKGKDGYLIEKMNEPDRVVMADSLEAVRNFAGYYPSNYLFVMVPNAVSIYADKLPAFAVTADQAAYSKEFEDGLEGAVRYLDLTDSLKAAEESVGSLYYRTDHHWTTPAAYACAPGVFEALGREFSISFNPLPVCGDFKGSLISKSGFNVSRKDEIYVYAPETDIDYIVTGSDSEGKRATVYSEEGLMSNDPYTVFLGGNEGNLHIETGCIGGGSLLVFKDSYFNCFLPFLISSYETIDVVDPRYFSGDLQSLLYQNQYDNVMFFYNINTFAEDTSLSLVLNEVTEGGAK